MTKVLDDHKLQVSDSNTKAMIILQTESLSTVLCHDLRFTLEMLMFHLFFVSSVKNFVVTLCLNHSMLQQIYATYAKPCMQVRHILSVSYETFLPPKQPKSLLALLSSLGS